MIYRLTTVSKLWPDRVRVGSVIVPDDRAAIASFNRTWNGSPDVIRAELRRPDHTHQHRLADGTLSTPGEIVLAAGERRSDP